MAMYTLSILAKNERPSQAESPWFTEAKKNAQVPFLHHKVLECGYNGIEYVIEDHDITLRIPEGAVAEGKKIHLEIAVAMYGPFNFSVNTQPISPIVWLCLLEEYSELKKPFVLIVPHFLTELTRERLRYHEVRFAKAKHNRYTLRDDQIRYNFNSCETPTLFASNGCKSYGILKSNHCCFYCLKANITEKLATDVGYCLVRIESSLSCNMRNEVYFIAVFFLDTCMYRGTKIRFFIVHCMWYYYYYYNFRLLKSNFHKKMPTESITVYSNSRRLQNHA